MLEHLEFHSESALLSRLRDAAGKREVVVLAGSGLTMPLPGIPGVPKADDIVDMIRAELSSDEAASQEFEQVLASTDNRYQAAFGKLSALRGPEVVNRLIRQAVLNARRLGAPQSPNAVLDEAPDVYRAACKELETDTVGWALSPGVEALGRLAAGHRRFGQTILTTNFDPLIEISIARAQGRPYRLDMGSDGSLVHTQGEGCRVVHLHGHWSGGVTLHTPAQLLQPRDKLETSLRHLLGRGCVLLVLAYSGWDDILTRTLARILEDPQATPQVLWTFYKKDETRIRQDSAKLLRDLGLGSGHSRVTLFRGIDVHRFLPRLANALASTSGISPLPMRSTGLPDRPGLASETPDRATEEYTGALEEVAMKRDKKVSQRAALEKLLGSLFGTDALKRWLVLEYPDIPEDEWPSSRLSRASYVHKAVEVLGHHIDIGQEFFERLLAARQRRARDILAVRDAWLVQDADRGMEPVGNPAPELRSSASVSAAAEPVVRILHLSDFHFRATTKWDAEPVLGRLAADVARLAGIGLVPDLIMITGDIAFSGKVNEYELAAEWIRERLLPAAGVGPGQLFLVPGNHDADRDLVDMVARHTAQGLLRESQQQDVAALLGGESGTVFLRRHQAFVEFVNRIGASGAPMRRPWHALTREIRGVRIHCAGFSSAWLASGDDRGRLLLGLWQCNELLRGADDAEIVIAAMHHPWDYLAEWDQVSRVEIERSASLVLRGHLHDVRHTFTQSTHHDGVLEFAAGACYENSRSPNSYHLVELFPRAGRARIHPRHWDPHRRDWQPDHNLFHAPYGEKPLAIRHPRF